LFRDHTGEDNAIDAPEPASRKKIRIKFKKKNKKL
jgi:hypothetical protein